MKTGGIHALLSVDLGRALRKCVSSGRQGMFPALLLLWTLLPVGAMVWNLYLTALIGGVSYLPAFLLHPVLIYRTLFRLLGLLTLCAVLAYAVRFGRRDWKNLARAEPWHFLLLGMLLWAGVSTLLAEDRAAAFWGTYYRSDGFLSYLFYAAVYAAAFLTAGERERLRVFRFLVAVANLCALVMFGQAWEFPALNFVLPEFHAGLSAVFSNSDHLGYYLTVSLLLLCGLFLYNRGRGWSVFYLLSFAFQTGALLLNNTFGCYLAVLAALPAALLFYRRSARKLTVRECLPLLVFLGLSVLYFLNLLPLGPDRTVLWRDNFSTLGSDLASIASGTGQSTDAGNGRFRLWSGALRSIAEHPLFGVGPEGLGSGFVPGIDNDRPHNEFLQHAAFLGIPALLLYVSALVTLLVHQWKHMTAQKETTLIAAGAVTGYLISSFFGNTMYYTAPYFFTVLGFAASRETDSPLTVPEEPPAQTESTEPAEIAQPVRKQDEPRPGIRYKRLAVLAAAGAAAAGLVIGWIAFRTEGNLEQADLSLMALAYNRGRQKLAENPGTSGVFYLETVEGVLVSEPGPACGMGTPLKSGRNWGDLLHEWGEYDPRGDYRDSILRVTLDPDAGEDPVKVEWVRAGQGAAEQAKS